MTQKPTVDRQREHQANERTFLAWLRTSIALIGFGFAIARFGLFLQQLQITLTPQSARVHPFLNSSNLGLSLVILGIATILIAGWHYNQVFWQIERGDYRPSRWLVWVMTIAVAVLGSLSIPLVLWRNFNTPVPPHNSDRPNLTKPIE